MFVEVVGSSAVLKIICKCNLGVWSCCKEHASKRGFESKLLQITYRAGETGKPIPQGPMGRATGNIFHVGGQHLLKSQDSFANNLKFQKRV